MERPVLEIPLLCRSKGVSRTRRSGKYAFPERPVLENMIFRNGPFWSPSFQNGSSGSIQGARLWREDLFLSPPPAGRACSAAGQPGSAERLVLVYGIGGSSRIYISHFSPGTAAAESATSQFPSPGHSYGTQHQRCRSLCRRFQPRLRSAVAAKTTSHPYAAIKMRIPHVCECWGQFSFWHCRPQ